MLKLPARLRTQSVPGRRKTSFVFRVRAAPTPRPRGTTERAMATTGQSYDGPMAWAQQPIRVKAALPRSIHRYGWTTRPVTASRGLVEATVPETPRRVGAATYVVFFAFGSAGFCRNGFGLRSTFLTD